MAVFIVIPTATGQEVATSVQTKFPDKHFKLPRGEFLVSFAGTSKQLSDELGISDGTGGTGVVASLSGYFGRAPTDVWEWITQHWTSEK